MEQSPDVSSSLARPTSPWVQGAEGPLHEEVPDYDRQTASRQPREEIRPANPLSSLRVSKQHAGTHSSSYREMIVAAVPKKVCMLLRRGVYRSFACVWERSRYAARKCDS